MDDINVEPVVAKPNSSSVTHVAAIVCEDSVRCDVIRD